MSHSLMTVKYLDGTRNISLTNYADTVVYDTSGKKKTLCAIRFGGYPEQVNGMVQAIHGGASVTLDPIAPAGAKTLVLHSLVKQYRRKVSHDGVYAEATLIAEDENQKAKSENKKEDQKKADDLDNEQTELELPPRNSFIYVASGDKRALFDAIDRKTGVPMIPEFADYIIAELKQAKILTPLTVISSSLKFEAWVLKSTAGDQNIIELDKLYTAYVKGVKNCFAVISKEMARDGYMHMPAVVWSKTKKGFICPDCGEVIQMSISEDGTRYIVDADQFFFQKAKQRKP